MISKKQSRTTETDFISKIGKILGNDRNTTPIPEKKKSIEIQTEQTIINKFIETAKKQNWSIHQAQSSNNVLTLIEKILIKTKAKNIVRTNEEIINKLDISKYLESNNYKETSESDVVVITAGLPRKPGMSRMDLLATNGKIIKDVTSKIMEYSTNPKIIVVTNPLDQMTALASQISGLPKSQVIGQAGILDTSRFAYFISEKTNTPIKKVQALTLGSHGETMVPVPSQCFVDNKPLTDLLTDDEINELVEKTSNGGAEIVALLKTGSAYFAPASAAAKMVKAIISDSKEAMPVCSWMSGEYGIENVYLGVNAVLGANGGEKVIELKLTENEIEECLKASKAVNGVWTAVDFIPAKDRVKDYPYIIEVNSSPGTEGIEEASGQNISKEIIKHFNDKKNWIKVPAECGYKEVVTIKPFGEIVAKFDTGNSGMPVIHADKLKVSGKKVTWSLLGKTITSDIIDTEIISVGGLRDYEEKRYVVSLDVEFAGGLYTDIEFTLDDREDKSPILFDREFMNKLNVMVNPNRKYVITTKYSLDDDKKGEK